MIQGGNWVQIMVSLSTWIIQSKELFETKGLFKEKVHVQFHFFQLILLICALAMMVCEAVHYFPNIFIIQYNEINHICIYIWLITIYNTWQLVREWKEMQVAVHTQMHSRRIRLRNNFYNTCRIENNAMNRLIHTKWSHQDECSLYKGQSAVWVSNKCEDKCTVKCWQVHTQVQIYIARRHRRQTSAKKCEAEVLWGELSLMIKAQICHQTYEWSALQYLRGWKCVVLVVIWWHGWVDI